MLPPMTERFDLLISSMQAAARAVLLLFLVANAILVSRWSIRFVPDGFRQTVLNLFDMWLVVVNLYLFIITAT